MEGCFYECEVNAGLYRKYTDAQHQFCSGAADGAYNASLNYTCQVSPWGGNAENRWQLYKMPITPAFAEAWYRACANDLFCGDGDYFQCAGDYHAQLANETYWAEFRANQTAAALAAESGRLPPYGIAIIAVAAALSLLLLICICCMARQEKKGKPVFTNMEKQPAA